MKNVYTEEQVKERTDKLQKLTDRHDELVEKEKTGRARMSELNKEMQDAEALIQKHQRELHRLGLGFQTIGKESQLNVQQREALKKELAGDKFEKELRAEIKTQPTFFDLLPTVLEKINKEICDGLNGLENKFDPAEMSKTIQDAIYKNQTYWNQPLGVAQDYVTKFDACMREICRKKLMKEKITARELQHKNQMLSDFCLCSYVEPLWNKL